MLTKPARPPSAVSMTRNPAYRGDEGLLVGRRRLADEGRGGHGVHDGRGAQRQSTGPGPDDEDGKEPVTRNLAEGMARAGANTRPDCAGHRVLLALQPVQGQAAATRRSREAGRVASRRNGQDGRATARYSSVT